MDAAGGFILCGGGGGWVVWRWRWRGVVMGVLQWLAGYLGMALFSCGVGHGGGGLVSSFYGFYSSIGAAFTLAGAGRHLSFYVV